MYPEYHTRHTLKTTCIHLGGFHWGLDSTRIPCLDLRVLVSKAKMASATSDVPRAATVLGDDVHWPTATRWACVCLTCQEPVEAHATAATIPRERSAGHGGSGCFACWSEGARASSLMCNVVTQEGQGE